MNEHPVPRNITGFQFQLIGFMTLKQFGYLAFGFLLAFAFFRAPLSFFRFPLSAFFLFLGIAFAFIPIQERPLEIWLLNMIRSMYAPTQFIWQKEAVVPAYLTWKPTRIQQQRPNKQQLIHQETRAKLAAYMATLSKRDSERLDAQEEETLKRVNQLFGRPISVKPIAAETVRTEAKPISSAFSTLTNRLFTHQTKQPSTPAQTSETHTTAALPPGVVAGLVKTPEGMLSGALVHIYNDRGEQMRLLKTNNTGKFSLTLPLESGKYILNIEDPTNKYQFNSFAFTVGQEHLHPWLVVAKKEVAQ